MKSDELKKSKRPGTDRKWTLLFIGDHGNVVTLKHFKAIVIGAGFLFVLALVFVGALLYLNQVARSQNKEFQKQFLLDTDFVRKGILSLSVVKGLVYHLKRSSDLAQGHPGD